MAKTKHQVIDTSTAYFLDFEACSLSEDSWPIEIGIARIVDAKVETESCLIRPHSAWSKKAWSEQSAGVHGLSLNVLEENGVDAKEAAKWFKNKNTGLAISDAPEFERRWLVQLLATDLPFPEVNLLDFDSYVRMSLPNAAAVARVYRYLANAGPTPHRAGPAAERLARAWVAGASCAPGAESAHAARPRTNRQRTWGLRRR